MKHKNKITILAIETSCDDTCIALIKSQIPNPKSQKFWNFKILSNVVSSQVKLHTKYGGVYPTLAKREHQRNLLPVLIRALKQAELLKNKNSKLKTKNSNSKLKTLENIFEREKYLYKETIKFFKKYQKPNIDAIAVTIGPGLEPCLWVGVNFAKTLSFYWDLPIIPVNHIEAHVFANFIDTQINTNMNTNQHKNLFPAVCLVVSGGHTQLILMRGFGKYKIIGETRDDAAGECFDKVARILGLGYPGGPIVAKMATKIKNQKSKIKNIKLPRPMIYQKNYDFSFSGLKTAVLYKTKEFKKISKRLKAEFCYETQQAIIDVLLEKTIKAAKDFKAKTIILGGGVAANNELRNQFKLKIKNLKLKINFLLPDKKFCTDNAAMVGLAASYKLPKEKIKSWKNIKANANLKLQT